MLEHKIKSWGKTLLKRSFKLARLYSGIKGFLQEREVSRLIAFYRAEVSKRGISVPRLNQLRVKLRERLTSRGLHPLPKQKGSLHIFVAGPSYAWSQYISSTLMRFGRTTFFEWDSLGFDEEAPNFLQCYDAMNRAMQEAFLKAHAEQPVDAVLGYFSGYNTSPEVLRRIAQKGAVIFNYSCARHLSLPRSESGGLSQGPEALISAVDLTLCLSPHIVTQFMIHGGLAMWWPWGADPTVFKPYDVPFEFDVSFAGKATLDYGRRQTFIKNLRKLGINVVTFGEGWENGPLSIKEMVELIARSRINLGFAGMSYSWKIKEIKNRDFEIPMSGGLYLTQMHPDLSLIYEVGKEIVTYEDERDCANKIRWLLYHPEEAEKIRKAGRARALRDHTWERRFSQIFEVCGIMEPSISRGS